MIAKDHPYIIHNLSVMSKLHLALFLSFLSTIALGQNLKGWQIDIQSGMQFGLFIDAHKNGLGDYDPLLDGFEEEETLKRFPLANLSLGVGVAYRLKPYLKISTSFQQAGLWRSTNSMEVSDGIEKITTEALTDQIQRLSLNCQLDMLYKSPFEELSFILGMSGYIIYNRSISNAYTQNNSRPGFTINGSTRTMRQIRYIGLNLGLEWRDYFSEHFGYFFRLSYQPKVNVGTSSLLFEQINIDGVSNHPLEGETIKPGNNNYPEENFSFDLLLINFGLSYKW